MDIWCFAPDFIIDTLSRAGLDIKNIAYKDDSILPRNNTCFCANITPYLRFRTFQATRAFKSIKLWPVS